MQPRQARLSNSDMPKEKKIRKRRVITHKFCPHCEKTIHYKTFKYHRHLYFDEKACRWVKDSSTTTKSSKRIDEAPNSDIDIDSLSDIAFSEPPSSNEDNDMRLEDHDEDEWHAGTSHSVHFGGSSKKGISPDKSVDQ